MGKLFILIIDTGAGLQQELYKGDVECEEKGNFLRIRDKFSKTILGIYPTARVVGGRFIDQEELAKMVATAQANSKSLDDSPEPLHTGDRPQDS